MKKPILFCIMATLLAEACAPKLPVARMDDTVDTYFGTEVADPYRWLEDDRSEKTLRWVEAENKVTNDYLSRIPFRQKLLKRLTEVSNYEKIGSQVLPFSVRTPGSNCGSSPGRWPRRLPSLSCTWP